MKPSRGTVIPRKLRELVYERDGHKCVGAGRLPGECNGPLSLDHVRPSGGISMKSDTDERNLVTLCLFSHHEYKTTHVMTARPVLLAYLFRLYPDMVTA